MKKSTRLKTTTVFDNSTRTIVKRENERLGVHCYVWIPKNRTGKAFIPKDVFGRQNIYYNDMEKGVYKTLKKKNPPFPSLPTSRALCQRSYPTI